MRRRPRRRNPVKSVVLKLEGGLNEASASLDWKGGELLGVRNYLMASGTFGGYTRVDGYERFDGQTQPSTVDATEDDHVDQDAARTAITEVGTVGSPCEGEALGVIFWNDTVFAFRKKVGINEIGMYESTASGWSEVDTSADPLVYDATHDYRYLSTVFNFYATNDTDPVTPYGFRVFWVDGFNQARTYDGTTVSVIDNGGMSALGLDKPQLIAAHDNRLWLSYEGGSLQYSELGDPTSWGFGTAVSSAGEVGVGDTITNLVPLVGTSLVIFSRNQIRLLNGFGEINWTLDSFSDECGAYNATARRMLGTVYFMDDRGVTNLQAVDTFGDFSINGIDDKVKRTVVINRTKVSTAVEFKDKNQYRLFYNDGSAVVFSFDKDKLKGSTILQYPDPVYHVTTGEDSTGKQRVFFTSDTGYVYEMDSGTSFDGEAIEAILLTSYYHYNSPRNWKTFKKFTVEVYSPDELTLQFRSDFDYGDPDYQKSIDYFSEQTPLGGRWDIGVWDVMNWSGKDVNRSNIYINGIGTNMSVTMYSSETYSRSHTVQNIITDYTLGGRQI